MNGRFFRTYVVVTLDKLVPDLIQSVPSMYRYRQAELYRVVADVSSYHKFIPFCTSSRILESSSSLHAHLTARDKPDVLEMDGELTVAFLTLKESYVSKVTCKPYESVQVRLHSPSHPVHGCQRIYSRPSHCLRLHCSRI